MTENIEKENFLKINKLHSDDEDENSSLFYNELFQKLIDFSMQGEAENIQELVRLNPTLKHSICAEDEFMLAPVHYAARFNNMNCVKIMYELDKNSINHKNKRGLSPLHFAAKYLPTLTSKILENQLMKEEKEKKSVSKEFKNVFVEDQDKKQYMGPDEFCIFIKKPKVSKLADSYDHELEKIIAGEDALVKFLIEKGAKVNETDQNGQTPLHYAVIRDNLFAANEILKSSMSLFGLDKYQMTPLHYAAQNDNLHMVKLLLRYGADIISSDISRNTPFSLAIKNGNWKVAEYLYFSIEKKFGQKTLEELIVAPDIEGMSPIHYAILNGNFECIQFTFYHQSHLELINRIGETPLHIAAKKGFKTICGELIFNNVNISVQNKDGSTPIHYAIQYKNLEVVNLLLNNKANIELMTKNGFTPILLAAKYNFHEAVNILVENKCSFDVEDRLSRNVVFLAAEYNSVEFLMNILTIPNIRTILNKVNLEEYSPLMKAASLGNVEILNILLDHGADPVLKNDSEETVLHISCYKNNPRIVDILCNFTKDFLNTINYEGNAPIHIASKMGHVDVVAVLIDHHANLQATNTEQMDCLAIAAANGHEKVIKLLIEKGLDPNIKDHRKLPPLHWACRNGYPRSVSLLLQKGANPSFRVRTNDILINNDSNALDIAIDNGNLECGQQIIRDPRHFYSTMKNRIVNPDGRYDTPLRKMIRQMPKLAKEVFDKCISTNGLHPSSFEFEIQYNFEIIDDTFADWGNQERNYKKAVSTVIKNNEAKPKHSSVYDEKGYVKASALPYTMDKTQIKENHPLNLMVVHKREELLEHSLTDALMIMKWNEHGFAMYLINIVFYIIFLIVSSHFIMSSAPPYTQKPEWYNGSFTGSCDFLDPPDNYKKLLASKYSIMIISLINLIKEIVQIFRNPRSYFNYENIIELILYISSFLLVLDFSECSERTIIRQDWQWELATLCIFLTWFNLLLFAQKVPNHGLYVIVFIKVTKTFIKFSMFFLTFLTMYSFTFYTLFANKESFNTIPLAYVKTGVMMLGELDYEDLFNDVSYSYLSYAVFVSFLVIMSVIMMNLMVGLAVDDIKSVLSEARMNCIAKRVELSLEMEIIMPMKFMRKNVYQYFTIKPNYRKKLNFILNYLFQFYIPKTPNIPELLKMENNLIIDNSMENHVLEIKRIVQRLQGQVNQMNLKLAAMNE